MVIGSRRNTAIGSSPYCVERIRLQRFWVKFAASLASAIVAGLACQTALADESIAGITNTTVMPASPVPLTVTPPHVRFPLKVAPTKHYLVDQSGRPFMIVGDSPQSLIVNLTLGQANQYLADRQRAGFNSLWINLLCDQYTGGRADGTTYDGVAPFTTPGDLSTPNPAYFARVDEVLRMAAEHQFEVFLDPIETGGWLQVLEANGVQAAYQYGLYLGRRYRKFSNIVWLNGNDFQSWSNSYDDSVVEAVAEGIKAADPSALQTVELNFLESTSLDDPSWRKIIDLNAVYNYFPNYVQFDHDYGAGMPSFLVEASYEGEHYYTGPSTLRRQEYWAMLSGAAGQFYGNAYTWPFRGGWSRRLDTVGSQQITYLVNLFSSRAWFDLVPDVHHKLVVSGYGTPGLWDDVNSNDYVTAARTPGGKLAMAYLPNGGSIRVAMNQMAGPRVSAQWYDPTRGTYKSATGSPLAHAGTHRFTAPARNHEGDRDWILILTATKAKPTKKRHGTK